VKEWVILELHVDMKKAESGKQGRVALMVKRRL
jgi:hypothetical protein